MIKDLVSEHVGLAQELLNSGLIPAAEAASDLIVAALKKGGKVLVAGNGGSAADSQHFAGELVGKFKKVRKGFPVISLTTDTSVITAWGNDMSFDTIFSRQVEALGKEGDLFVGFSTSGNSKNIIEAVREAKERGLKVVLFLGNSGGELAGEGDIELIIPSANTPRVQEMHVLLMHAISEVVENKLS